MARARRDRAAISYEEFDDSDSGGPAKPGIIEDSDSSDMEKPSGSGPLMKFARRGITNLDFDVAKRATKRAAKNIGRTRRTTRRRR